MNYTRPNITEGKWTIHNDGLDFTLTGVSHGCTQFVCRVDASETQGKAEGEANARAISALPQVLAALELAMTRLEELDYLTGGEHLSTATLDEIRESLTAAGYSFQ